MAKIFSFLTRKTNVTIEKPENEMERIKRSEHQFPEHSKPLDKANIEVLKDTNENLSYDIYKIREQVAKIEKEEGGQAIISYLKEFLDNNHLRFNHLISLFKVLVRNMKKTKEYTAIEIYTYVINQIEKYSEKNNVEFYYSIADILGRINKNYGISFLESKVNPSETDAIKDINYLLPMITLANWYKEKEKTSELKERVFSLFSRKVNDLDFKNLYSSLSTLICFWQGKSENSNQEKIDFINEHIKKFTENNDFNTIKKIADLYEIIGIQYSIQYLEQMNGKTDDDYNILLKLSDNYLKVKESDKAFRTIQQASFLIMNIRDDFDFLWKQGEVTDKFANICYNGQAKPMYSDFLHYTFVSFILESARDLLLFPSLAPFYYRKKICYENNWGLDSDTVDDALNDLNIFEYKKDLVKNINDWTFYKLPILMGVPDRFVYRKSLDDTTISDVDFSWVLSNNVTLNHGSIKDIPALVHKFVSEAVKELYDRVI